MQWAGGGPVTLGVPDASHLTRGEGRRDEGEDVGMSEYLQVWRCRVAADDVNQLLEAWPAAMAEARWLCPELLRSQLVRLDDGAWLDMLTWSAPDSAERLMQHADEFDAVAKLHALFEGADLVGLGEIARSAP